jgi:hypothetical protein
MMTLTASHRRKGLVRLLDQMTAAKRRMQNRKAWQRLRKSGPLIGSVSVREATHGKNGWHPHYHVVLLIDAISEEEALSWLEPLRDVWLDCLSKEGLTGSAERAFDLSTGSSLAAYLAKFGRDEDDREAAASKRDGAWGVAEEATLSRVKQANGKNRTPFQILRDAHAGCEVSEKLWREYGNAMYGRRQQVWSDGLKALIGIGEVDDEAAAEPEAYSDELDETIVRWWNEGWKRVRHRQIDIKEAAEAGGAGAVEAFLGTIDASEKVDPGQPPPPRAGGLREQLIAMSDRMREVRNENRPH